MGIRTTRIAVMCVLAAAGSIASAGNMTFDDPVVTGGTQAAGVWYTDRYAPAGFTAPVFFDGDNRLRQSISAADGASSRAPSFSSAFYNTQGRKFDVATGTQAMSIDLYVPADWETTGRRMAGFWGSASAGAAILAYPIIEFTSESATPMFRGWNGTGWTTMGLPTGFAYDAWYTLDIQLVGSQFVYSVNGELVTAVDAAGSTGIVNTILQGHNTTDGVSYDIHWDNLVTVIPLPPAAWAGLATLAGVAGVGYIRRRRSN